MCIYEHIIKCHFSVSKYKFPSWLYDCLSVPHTVSISLLNATITYIRLTTIKSFLYFRFIQHFVDIFVHFKLQPHLFQIYIRIPFDMKSMQCQNDKKNYRNYFSIKIKYNLILSYFVEVMERAAGEKARDVS